MKRPQVLLMSAVLLFALLGVAAVADDTDSSQSQPTDKDSAEANYDLCLSAARAYPQQGLYIAEEWMTEGGGEPAEHCAAVSLINLRKYAAAGARLENMATVSHASDAVRMGMGMLAQAAQAWFMDGNNERAYRLQSEALALAPRESR